MHATDSFFFPKPYLVEVLLQVRGVPEEGSCNAGPPESIGLLRHNGSKSRVLFVLLVLRNITRSATQER